MLLATAPPSASSPPRSQPVRAEPRLPPPWPPLCAALNRWVLAIPQRGAHGLTSRPPGPSSSGPAWNATPKGLPRTRAQPSPAPCPVLQGPPGQSPGDNVPLWTPHRA